MKSTMRKLMPIAMIGGMVVMMAVMMLMRSGGASTGASAATGGGIGGMMMMMMMLMSRMGQAGQNGEGPSEADIDKSRKKNSMEISKKREVVHGIGEAMHVTTVRTLPNPYAMPTLIGAQHDTLWSVNPHNNDGIANGLAEEGTLARYPAYTARIGVGPRELNPQIDIGDMTDVTETREPVIYTQNVNFMTVNGAVQECAIGVNLTEGAYSLTRSHDREAAYCLARTMLLSLAYAHSPTNLHVVVVTSEDNRDKWEWVKWLPHNENVFADPDSVSRHGFVPMFYTDMRSATRDLMRFRREAKRNDARIYVVVDTPDEVVSYPTDLIVTAEDNDAATQVIKEDGRSVIAVDDVTMIIVNGFDEEVTMEEERFDVTLDNQVHFFPLHGVPIRCDDTSIEVAERVARHLAGIRPEGFGQLAAASDDVVDHTPVAVDAPTLMDVVGTADLSTYDLRRKWQDNDDEENFLAPVGFEVDSRKYNPTGELAELDILQHSSGGSGPHGLFSGSTGTGKSFLLKCILLIWMLRFSPRRVVFILADFKGGATFNDFAGMPHVLACLSNLRDAVDMVDRTRAALEGEVLRRQELLKRWGCEDYVTYNKMKRKNPDLDMPDLPALVFVADEFREFIKNNPSYKEMFASIAAVGRSLRIHLLLGSQYLDTTLLGDAMEQFTYGFTLKVESAARSNAVIKSGEGATLPPNRVAVLRSQHMQESRLTWFQGFNHGLAYDPAAAVKTVDGRTAPAPAAPGDNTAEVLTFDTAQFTRAASLSGQTDSSIDIIDHDPKGRDTREDEEVRDQFTAVRDMILEKGADYTTPRTLWAEPMSVPMSLAHISDDYWGTIPDGTLRLGDIDVPFEHRRKPMEVSLNGKGSSIAVYGDRGTGRSTTVKTLVASSAMRHTGNRVGWLLYDYSGNSLSDMEPWPNVAAYANRTDNDMWLRMRGEVDRIMALRETAWTTHRPADLNDYIDRKADLGITDDPYGHLVIAIDGFGAWIEAVKDDHPDLVDWVKTLVTRGPQYGVHIVVTLSGKDGFKAPQLGELFSTKIILNHDDPADAPARGLPLRTLLGTIPSSTPGRVADGSMTTAKGEVDWHHGRIMVPVAYRIEEGPLPGGGFGYDHSRNYSDAIRDLGTKIAEFHERETPGTSLEKLMAPKGAVSFQKTWNLVQSDNPNLLLDGVVDGKQQRVAGHERKIPLGVSMATGKPYYHDLQRTARARHLLIAGAAGRGATTLLRTHMSGVMATYSPSEASMILLDGGGALIDFQQRAVERGFMKPTNYAMNRSKLTEISERLEKIIDMRMPSEELLQSDPKLITTRGYFSGKEIFVYVDKYPSFKQPSPSMPGLEKLMALMESGIDVGIHFIVTETDAALSSDTMMSKFIAPMIADHPTGMVILSSGLRGGSPGYGIKYRHLPTGRVRMVNSSGQETEVQAANVGPLQ